jgi:hypothetical protein
MSDDTARPSQILDLIRATRKIGTVCRLVDGRIVALAGEVLDTLERNGQIAATYYLVRGTVMCIPRDR